jgi:hypothetical protein
MAIVFLDSGIIGLVTNPRKQGQALACEQMSNTSVVLPSQKNGIIL